MKDKSQTKELFRVKETKDIQQNVMCDSGFSFTMKYIIRTTGEI